MKFLIKIESSVENTPELDENLGVYLTNIARSGVYLASISQVKGCFKSSIV